MSSVFKDKLNSKHLSLTGFNQLLSLILFNNYFSFDNFIFLQISGIAMGCICGPSVANLFLLILEEKFLTIHKPLYYKRFIDDIFIVTLKDFDLDLLKNSFLYLKLNSVSNLKVNFLDLNIELCKFSNSLIFSLYTKPTNTFSYLLTSSNHPSFIFKNIPKSLFLRIRRICSLNVDYFYYARILFFQLLHRGYDFKNLRKVAHMVSNINRNTLIPYKIRKNFLNNTIFFKIPFDFNYSNLNSILSDTFKEITAKNINNIFSNTKFKVIYTKQPSIYDLFVNNFKINTAINCYYKRCIDSSCLVCSFANVNSFICLNNFVLPIINFSNCKTTSCVYILKCKLCNVYYIGQTNNFKRRLLQHIHDIKIFKAYYKYTSVSLHFNLKPHNFINDLSFFIFQNTNVSSIEQRHNLENYLIHLFIKLEIHILNDFIPNIYSIKSV